MSHEELILALRNLLPCNDLEIICDAAPTVSAGDILHLRKHNDAISGAYARWQDVEDITTNIEADDEEKTEAEIQISDASFSSCKFATNGQALAWSRIQNKPHIAIVTEIDKDSRRIRIMYAPLPTAIRKNFPLDIALTTNAVKKLGTFDSASRKLLNQYSFQVGNLPYAIVAHHLFGHESSFMLLDGYSCLSVTEEYRSECGGTIDTHSTEKVWAVKNGSRPYHQSDEYRIEIWQSKLTFNDATRAKVLSESARAILRSGNEKYISLWQKYAEIDFAYTTECMEKAGVLQFSKIVDHSPERAILRIDNYNSIPIFLEALEEIDKEHRMVDIAIDQNQLRKTHASLKSADVQQRIITVEFDEGQSLSIKNGIVMVNNHSAEIQFERRKEAYDRILNNQSAKPELISLLNGNMPHLAAEKKRITPLSQRILKKVFPEHDPTPNQIEAIKIALNTPDIAIIQGPPGTGKTTVIRAIYEAIAEKEKEPQLFFGRNLATAYQRDATVHLASDMSVYDLPAQTFLGRREGGWEEGNRTVVLWLEKLKRKVYEANPNLEGFANIDKLSNVLDLIRLDFNPDTAIDELRRASLHAFLNHISNYEKSVSTAGEPESYEEFEIQNTCASVDLTEFKQRAYEMLAAIDNDDAFEHEVDISYAVMLPTSPEAMEDDGRNMIDRIIRRLSDERQTEDVRATVNGLKKLYESPEIRFDRVKDGVNALLAKLKKRSNLIVNQKENNAFMELIQDTIQMLQDVVGDSEMYVLSRYVNAFEDTEAIKNSLSSFLTIIAATNQMVGSKDVISRKKSALNPDESLATGPQKEEKAVQTNDDLNVVQYDFYENVVIDEAARSCPPDLLIPLCRAKDRMILVGDQKQLPQFISENVYKRMEGEQNVDLLRKSMFEYLIDQVSELAATGDGVQRYIMLDQQFRMPAIIGDLVSRHFYDGKLKSPLGNGGNKLPSGLSFAMKKGKKNERIANSHLIWLDVAGHLGTREEKDLNKSTYRTEEVVRVTEMLKTLVSSAEGNAKDYTYGIITFYKAQENKLNKAIRAALLECENPVCTEKWFNAHIEIGTVDAFQGKEFDIVFLSMVRCHTDYGTFHYGAEDKGRARYGFTMDENRLCVALSRVKKCLIVAGDANMFNDDTARSIMPAIYDLVNICKESDKEGDSYAWFIPDNSGKKNA